MDYRKPTLILPPRPRIALAVIIFLDALSGRNVDRCDCFGRRRLKRVEWGDENIGVWEEFAQSAKRFFTAQKGQAQEVLNQNSFGVE